MYWLMAERIAGCISLASDKFIHSIKSLIKKGTSIAGWWRRHGQDLNREGGKVKAEGGTRKAEGGIQESEFRMDGSGNSF